MSEQTGTETPAPSAEVTPEVAPEQATPPQTGTETEQENKETPPATKTFTQEEVNDIVKRAKAATESKTERRVLRTLESIQQRQPQPSVQHETPASGPREGETQEAYIERMVEEKFSRRNQQESLKSVVQKTDDLYVQASKVQGFDRDTFDSLPLTPAMAQTLSESDADAGAKLMAFLCENPEEVDRIAKLPTARQAAELGKLEARATQPKPKVNPPKAPAPIETVGKGKAPVTDLSRMSAEEYFEHRMKQKPVWAR